MSSWLLAHLNTFADRWMPANLAIRTHRVKNNTAHTSSAALTEIVSEADGAASWAKRREFRKLYVRPPRP